MAKRRQQVNQVPRKKLIDDQEQQKKRVRQDPPTKRGREERSIPASQSCSTPQPNQSQTKKTPTMAKRRQQVNQVARQKLIDEAAKCILLDNSGQQRGLYQKMCRKFHLNLGPKGEWLGAKGDEYKRLQTAVRKLRRREQVINPGEGKGRVLQTAHTHTPMVTSRLSTSMKY